MKALTGPPPLSERTRRAVQDYTALNTITTAAEHARGGDASLFDYDLLLHMRDCDETYRLPLASPLGRRMVAVGLLRPVGTRGVVRRAPRT